MYNIFPGMYPNPPTNMSSVDAVRMYKTMVRFQRKLARELEEEAKKKEDDKKKKDAPPKDTKKWSAGEVFLLLVALSPITGFAALWIMAFLAKHSLDALQLIVK